MTTAFTDDEITTCAAGASLICIKTVVMNADRTVTFTKGKEYKVVTASRYVLGLTNNLGAPHLINPQFMREHFTASETRPQPVRVVVHLTETGANAGRRLCTADRSDGARNVHAVYAPLQNPTFRDQVCTACLQVWADKAYEDGDAMPDYIAELRNNSKATCSEHGNSTQLQLEAQ